MIGWAPSCENNHPRRGNNQKGFPLKDHEFDRAQQTDGNVCQISFSSRDFNELPASKGCQACQLPPGFVTWRDMQTVRKIWRMMASFNNLNQQKQQIRSPGQSVSFMKKTISLIFEG